MTSKVSLISGYLISKMAKWLHCKLKNRFECNKGFILGEKINFEFEVDKTALVWYNSCGAWLNGEYHIITEYNSESGAMIRKV